MDISYDLRTEKFYDLLPLLKKNNYVKLNSSWNDKYDVLNLLLEQINGDYIDLGSGVYVLIEDSDYKGLLTMKNMKMLEPKLENSLEIYYQ